MLPTPLVTDLDENVYEPAEDSFLLLDCFEDQLPFLQQRFGAAVPVVTEIGTGSGIVLSFIHQHVLPRGVYMTTDINPHACGAVIKTFGANKTAGPTLVPAIHDSFQMDLTLAIRPGTIDVLVFNPPYVPASEVPTVPTANDDPTWLDLALLGGENGMETTWKVLDGLLATLSAAGVAYILFCARNKPDDVVVEMRRRGWTLDTVIHRKAGWEVLSVVRFTR